MHACCTLEEMQREASEKASSGDIEYVVMFLVLVSEATYLHADYNTNQTKRKLQILNG
jgi:hypothetical protein